MSLVVMIYWFDVMGVGCSEMLFVCLRFGRIGRWARPILTIYIYILGYIGASTIDWEMPL